MTFIESLLQETIPTAPRTATQALPQLSAPQPFITDGGLETRLLFQDGVEFPEFAAFTLLGDGDGVETLTGYYAPYLAIAERHGTGIVLDTPTWRANLDWAARLGIDSERLAAMNRQAVELINALRRRHPSVTAVIDGVIGPRGDGYVIEARMSAVEAAAYHGLQARAFAEAGADMVSAITMTYAEEAIGVARAAHAVGLPVVISFTVETDGRLPSGQTLGEAIEAVDAATGAYPAYYMINCAHPTHFLDQLDQTAAWTRRIRGIRANASTSSHAELDAATKLDRGDITELAGLYRRLSDMFDLRVIGGCCGTDHDHVAAIADAVLAGGVMSA